MKRLQREEADAITGKDKHGRFGLLVPMESDKDTSKFTAEDNYDLNCFIGDGRIKGTYNSINVVSLLLSPARLDESFILGHGTECTQNA